MKPDRGSRHRDPPPRAARDGPYRMPSRTSWLAMLKHRGGSVSEHPNPAVLGEPANAIPLELLKAKQDRIGVADRAAKREARRDRG